MLMPSLCQEGGHRDDGDTAGWSDSPTFSLLFIVSPCMAAAPADMVCEPMAFHLPALPSPYPTGIPIQMGAQEHKAVPCWRNLMGDWLVEKL